MWEKRSLAPLCQGECAVCCSSINCSVQSVIPGRPARQYTPTSYNADAMYFQVGCVELLKLASVDRLEHLQH
jgi:hypothetical protein